MATKITKRPDMKDYFKARIDFHVNGMMSSSQARMPRGVKRVHGDVDDYLITVLMDDGSVFEWTAGDYSSRKVNGCYAPLMPKPVK